jgi:superfamily II DNA or RNA helicase
MPFLSPSPRFNWSINSEGIAIRFSTSRRYLKASKGISYPDDQLAFIRMSMLLESGQASAEKVDDGIFLNAADAVRLDAKTRECFELPHPWPGGMRLRTNSVPQFDNFSALLGLVDPVAGVQWDWKLKGPLLEVVGQFYLPTVAQYAALTAFQAWNESHIKDELANLSMLATLRDAKREGCLIELAAYEGMDISHAVDLSIDARKDASGDLILRPIVEGDFPGLDPDEVEQRYAQAGSEGRMVLRVRKTIVLMDEEKTAQFRALAERGRVPKSEVDRFAANPSAWLADHVFPDVEMDFSPRVTGIGYWKNVYAGAMWNEGEDWFGKKPEPEKARIDPTHDNQTTSATVNDTDEGEGDDRPVVALIEANDSVLRYGGPNWSAEEMTDDQPEPDFEGLARDPLDHQRQAVRWMARHARRALKNLDPAEGKAVGAGALFADDMGLGKTFSTLIFLRNWMVLWRTTVGGEPPAVLVVAPLSLLENWKAEIAKSYSAENRVFSRVLIAQSEGELNKVRRGQGARDRAIPGEVQEYGLGFGDGTARSIDMPGSCVLTTYQTLRDYRFSFAKAEWSVAVFDEAQNIKNPNALQTIAAKSLKAKLRITLTGTPVENHLGDFWSILDTSEPGPLGSFAEFRTNWINRMKPQDPVEMGAVGKELRDKVDLLMLRRMKGEELGKALPEKTGHNTAIPIPMGDEQASVYDSILSSLDGIASDESRSPAMANQQLAALWQIRQVSLHPDLLAGGEIQLASNEAEARSVLGKSAKLKWLLETLDGIRIKGEKALVFCVQKKLQQALALHLGKIYGISIPVINGDTKASSRVNPEATRLGLIEQFSNITGFGVCVLSPIAAGAGLNIVAANHVIHLERHWNPAKEDQATDRAYRIGQKKPVFVYLPTTTHPSGALSSFDEVLHRLIERKRGLQGALGLVPAQQVSDAELIGQVFLSLQGEEDKKIIEIEEVGRLEWHLFEGLIALLYERESNMVILTPGGNDHGCDVVVRGYGRSSEKNLLIQCKSTKHRELDSERAVREVEGARPYYENALGIQFNERVLHTNASRLSRRTLRAAEMCKVTVRDRSWIQERLLKNPVKMSDLLARERIRQKV